MFEYVCIHVRPNNWTLQITHSRPDITSQLPHNFNNTDADYVQSMHGEYQSLTNKHILAKWERMHWNWFNEKGLVFADQSMEKSEPFEEFSTIKSTYVNNFICK